MRKSLNLSVNEVAKKMNKSKELINNWESGEDCPTYIQLEQLAKIYRRPIAVFFMPKLPAIIEPKADFRMLPDEFTDDLPSSIILMYRKAKLMQLNLIDIFKDSNIKNCLGEFEDLNLSDVTLLSIKLREILKVSFEDQISWKNSNNAFNQWRSKLEENGIFVFRDAFKQDNYYGFCLYDSTYPVIYINNTSTKTRQIFTLFHELAHLIFKVSGIDIEDDYLDYYESSYKNIEILCNKFAGEFLFPDDLFLAENLKFSEENVTLLSSKYSISREFVLRKYLNFKMISHEIYNHYTQEWIKQFRNKKSKGGDYYLTKKAYLGENYISLVFKNYYQGKYNIDKVSEYLNIKTSQIPKFESMLFGGI
jgi:Zn-dependent peptidase ImmA (M78 family)/DNA-binding XRE family transcriptional regulator